MGIVNVVTPPETYRPAPEKLAYTRHELCRVFGISLVALWRLEKKGLIRSVPGIRSKIYPRAEIERFLSLPPVVQKDSRHAGRKAAA